MKAKDFGEAFDPRTSTFSTMWAVALMTITGFSILSDEVVTAAATGLLSLIGFRRAYNESRGIVHVLCFDTEKPNRLTLTGVTGYKKYMETPYEIKAKLKSGEVTGCIIPRQGTTRFPNEGKMSHMMVWQTIPLWRRISGLPINTMKQNRHYQVTIEGDGELHMVYSKSVATHEHKGKLIIQNALFRSKFNESETANKENDKEIVAHSKIGLRIRGTCLFPVLQMLNGKLDKLRDSL